MRDLNRVLSAAVKLNLRLSAFGARKHLVRPYITLYFLKKRLKLGTGEFNHEYLSLVMLALHWPQKRIQLQISHRFTEEKETHGSLWRVVPFKERRLNHEK